MPFDTYNRKSMQRYPQVEEVRNEARCEKGMFQGLFPNLTPLPGGALEISFSSGARGKKVEWRKGRKRNTARIRQRT